MTGPAEHEIDSLLKEEYPLFFLEMNETQRAFVRARNAKRNIPKRRLYEAGNKNGKTEIGIAEDLAHSFGRRIWLPDDDPDYKVDVRADNIGLIGCETMAHSVPEKIEPTLRKLIPKTCQWKAKKNPQGYIHQVSFSTDPFGEKCESRIFIRSYDQEPATFEGLDYDWVHWDEPPPKPILQAAERGKVAHNAPSWFTMTPLKEAYIYDEYSLKAANNGGDDDEIFVLRGEIWDNCRDWCYKCDLMIPENAGDKRVVSNCPRCGRAMGFIKRQGIDEYLKTLDPEEREAREKGLWRHLSGLVYKTLDRETHLVDDFDISRTWMRIEGIDPHDAKPTCYLFSAVSPEEVSVQGKTRHRIYHYDYLTLKDDLDTMVRRIKEKRAHHGYDRPRWIVLDAKYGRREQIGSTCWEDELSRRGLGNIRLSRSNPGDVEIGHKLVREYFKPHHSVLTGESKPGMVFFRRGCSGTGGPIHHIFNYQYKPDKDDPDKQFKDFPDIIRYMALEGPVHSDPTAEAKVVNILTARMKTATDMRRRAQGG